MRVRCRAHGRGNSEPQSQEAQQQLVGTVGAVWALQRDSLSDGFGEGSGECVAKVK